jgi:hypothetical protein
MSSDDILDPIVDRTRQAREALAKECDYDLGKMAELFKSMEAEHPERVRDPRSLASKQRPHADTARPQ